MRDIKDIARYVGLSLIAKGLTVSPLKLQIYFMLGTNGFIYPLFFDPFHELNPMVK